MTINTRLIDHLPRRARAALRLLDAGTAPNAMLLRDFTRRERAALNALAAGYTPSAALYADLPRDVRAALRAIEPVSAVPAWVPEAFADGIWIEPRVIDGFATGRAWVAGVGVVDVDTLLGADPNTEDQWGETLYDEAGLTADGYQRPTSDSFAFIGAARTMLVAGATTQFRLKVSPTANDVNFVLLGADDAIELDINPSLYVDAYSYNGSYSERINGIVNTLDGGVVNVVACTFTPTRGEYAANGSEPSTGVLDETDWPIGGITAASLYADGPIYSIGIRPADADASNLTALSQTGITNTAPSGITIEWAGFDGTVPEDRVDNIEGQLTTADADGNPVTYTLVDDPDPRWSLFLGSILRFNVSGGLDYETEPSYSVTVRATDPGGLYVEEEFTITVTNVVEAMNSVAPVITGTPQVGETLTCSTGTWTGEDAADITGYWFQWYSIPTNGMFFEAAGESSIVLVEWMIGDTIKCAVSPMIGSTVGENSAESAETAAVIAAP